MPKKKGVARSTKGTIAMQKKAGRERGEDMDAAAAFCEERGLGAVQGLRVAHDEGETCVPQTEKNRMHVVARCFPPLPAATYPNRLLASPPLHLPTHPRPPAPSHPARRWPSTRGGYVKRGALDARLSGKTHSGGKRNSILTREEELDLIALAKYKNNLGDGEGRAWLDEQVCWLLQHRKDIHRGRLAHLGHLNKAAKATLARGWASKSWHQGFIANVGIDERSTRTLEQRRFDWCTKANSDVYFDELLEDLVDIGAVTFDEEGNVLALDLDRQGRAERVT
jgi:hypothetical protein